MIDRLALENFKSLKNRTEIALKPFTFIYGPNSSGKSSVIQSLLLLQQSNLDRVAFRNDKINLGNFRNVLSGQGIESNERDAISIGIEHAYSLDSLPKFGNSRTLKALSPLSRLNLEFQIRENKKFASDGSGMFTKFTLGLIGLDKSLTFAMSEKATKGGSAFAGTKWLLTEMAGFSIEDKEFLTGNSYGTLNRDTPNGVVPILYRQDDLSLHNRLGISDENGKTLLMQSRRALEEISSIVHVPPVRKLPDEVFRISDKSNKEYESSVYSMLAESPEAIEKVNEFLGRLDVEYEIKFLKPESVTESQRLNGVGTFTVNSKSSKTVLGFQDVGYGISQLVPVLASTFTGSQIVAIEQPELHLHPRLQSGIADALISARRTYGTQFLIESHSEGLMLRMQRRVREGVIDSNDVCVLYVNPDSNGYSSVIDIGLEVDGFFNREWPQGFFEDRFTDLF